MSYKIISTLDKFMPYTSQVVPIESGVVEAVALAVVGSSNTSPKAINISISDVVSSVSLKLDGTYIASPGISSRTIRIILPIAGQESLFTAANVAFTALPSHLLPTLPFSATYPFVADNTWNIIGAVPSNTFYLGDSFEPNGLSFNPDGTIMYVNERFSNETILQYTLSVPWNVSSATYVFQSAIVFGISLFMTPDGTRFYTCNNNDVVQYSLGTPYDVRTISGSTTTTFDLPALPNTLFFNPTGTIVYIGITDYTIYQYNVAVPYDINTVVSTGKSYNVSPTENASIYYSLYIKPDGTQLYVADNSTETVRIYTLSTPWDISTASPILTSFGVFSAPSYIYFKPDGTKMYIGTFAYNINEYELRTTPNTGIVSYSPATPSVFTISNRDNTIFPSYTVINLSGSIQYMN